MKFLGYITKKEATNLSVFGEKGERIVGGNIGDAVCFDEETNTYKILRSDEYEALNAKSKKTKPSEKGAVNE